MRQSTKLAPLPRHRFGPNGTPSLATAFSRRLSFARVVLPSLPGIDGTELCQALRGDAALSALPIILLSAMGNRLEQVANQAGATDCLAKPVSIAALKGLVEKYLPRPPPPQS